MSDEHNQEDENESGLQLVNKFVGYCMNRTMLYRKDKQDRNRYEMSIGSEILSMVIFLFYVFYAYSNNTENRIGFPS